ncbi:hypothetical protein Bca4012_058243 [Brassica carinata]
MMLLRCPHTCLIDSSCRRPCHIFDRVCWIMVLTKAYSWSLSSAILVLLCTLLMAPHDLHFRGPHHALKHIC